MSTASEIITVILADDHPVTRAGIRAMLQTAPDIQIVGEAQDGDAAQTLTAQLHPAILLLDLQMPGPRPADVEHWVRTHCPGTETLVLTAHDRSAYLSDMLDAGVVGYLCKEETTDTRLIDAIRRAASGAVLFDAAQLERARQWRETVGARWHSLSERERQVLTLIAQGQTDQEIADALGLKVKTVSNHVSQLLEKVGATSRTDAALWAIREGLIGGIT